MSEDSLPYLISPKEIEARLQQIFPEGTTNRQYVVREVASRVVFVMLYTGAVEGRDYFLRPNQVALMSDDQALKVSDGARLVWCKESLSSKISSNPNRWYADNSREQIRDESIRQGLVPLGAIVEKAGVSVTSPAGRYSLSASFAALFAPKLKGKVLEAKIDEWRKSSLSPGALARLQLAMRSASDSADSRVLVTLPNGEVRQMAYGASSVVSKAVIEQFGKRFLKVPALVFLSESQTKIIEKDDHIAKLIGINIDASKNLPDIIMADLGAGTEALIVFIEVVVSDGPVSEQRKEALLKYVQKAGLNKVAFVTAYKDRGSDAYKRTCHSLAWGSAAWFLSEPDCILLFKGSEAIEKRYLADL
jgi:hypothetical protein